MQSKSSGVMLKVKFLGACIRGPGGEIFMTHADSISQSVLLLVCLAACAGPACVGNCCREV